MCLRPRCRSYVYASNDTSCRMFRREATACAVPDLTAIHHMVSQCDTIRDFRHYANKYNQHKRNCNIVIS